MTTLNDIEHQAARYASARTELASLVQELNAAIETQKRFYLGAIKRKLSAAAAQHQALAGMIECAPHLFQKPRTVIAHGVRIGYQKGKGALEWDNDEQVVKLIRKHFPDEFDVLVKTEETPVKAALAQKSVADLKRLAVNVKDAGDEIVIKPTDSHVDKLVAALLKNATDEAAGGGD